MDSSTRLRDLPPELRKLVAKYYIEAEKKERREKLEKLSDRHERAATSHEHLSHAYGTTDVRGQSKKSRDATTDKYAHHRRKAMKHAFRSELYMHEGYNERAAPKRALAVKKFIVKNKQQTRK